MDRVGIGSTHHDSSYTPMTNATKHTRLLPSSERIVAARLRAGETASRLAAEYSTSLQTIQEISAVAGITPANAAQEPTQVTDTDVPQAIIDAQPAPTAKPGACIVFAASKAAAPARAAKPAPGAPTPTPTPVAGASVAVQDAPHEAYLDQRRKRTMIRISHVAKRFNVSRSAVYAWMAKDPDFPAALHIGSSVFFVAEDIEAYIDRLEKQAVTRGAERAARIAAKQGATA
ncbi:AlpA family phage regulatory protein [Dyella monticola]|uniref:AlpA family phage regulatory protein n=2 Tax=Dyella monticola TaxID=1927958 RepID=A0A370WSL4_9GAMM|nr:AlpA family phage regulatory protein [Dyella monticola]